MAPPWVSRRIGAVDSIEGVHDVRVEDHHARFSVDPAELNHLLAYLVDYDVRSLTSSPPSLDRTACAWST